MANGYKVKAFRFLLKPLDDELFSEAMGSALRELASRRKTDRIPGREAERYL